MKTRNHFRTLMIFFAGAFTGAMMVAAMLSTAQDPKGTSAGVYTQVTNTSARTLIRSYADVARTSTQPFRYFTISKEQYEAMQKIAGNNTTFTGMRIYPGKDNSGNLLGIIMGLDAAGKEDTIHPIYSTLARRTGICPDICD